MLTREQLEQFVKDNVRSLKRRKREQAAFALAALCFSGGYALGGKLVPDFKEGFKWIVGLQLALYVIGAIAFVYGVIRVWRLVNPPELPPAKDRPSAIKGPMAFTEADGELFRKLGRESELQKLLGLMLDDQVLMVVVRGASGAGKTSLLRAGLKHILGDRAIFHYWEAVPTDAEKGLARAILSTWPEKPPQEFRLFNQLVNPSNEVASKPHVIVLDQFEQMRGNEQMFDLLRRIVRESKPPHRITWVIAFRREFSADWMDFVSPELDRGFRPPQDVSLRLFTAEQAREVIGQLVNESNLKDSIEQSVINNLVEAATVEGEVSPVDIGIGLLVLAELHERQSGNTITIRDYQFAGGAEGLLTQYISRCLDLFPKESQEAILKAMLVLRDAETNQRLAEGRTVDELAAESGAEARLLKTQLDRLSHRDTRLLETVTPADGSAVRYRLPHERLIPALYRLTGELLAEVDQAKLKFHNAFQAWKTNDKRRHYLLKAKELRLVERYETQIPWGNDEQEKKSFLNRSRRQRWIVRGMAVIVAVGLIGTNWDTLSEYPRMEIERYLTERAYYVSLSAVQHQLKNLKKLELTRPLDLKRFNCLSSQALEELSLFGGSSLGDLTSLSKCNSLKKLTFKYIQVSDWEHLSKLSDLTQLELNLTVSRDSDFEPLSKLNNLTQLGLDLSYFSDSGLELLSKLSNLRQLSIKFGDSQISNLEPLVKLNNLEQLTLDLGNSQVSNLEPLVRLNNLKQLTLDLNGSRVGDLESLSKLRSRTRLMLNLSRSRADDLELLTKMGDQTALILSLNGSQVRDLEPLLKLRNLTQLTLSPSGSYVSDLELLSKLSDRMLLILSLSGNQGRDLEMLTKLNNLKQLTLNAIGSQVKDCELLSRLSNLTQLTLNLSYGQDGNLEPLSKLSNLRNLTLDISDSQVSNLEALSKLGSLSQLEINLTGSQVGDLEPLSRLHNLTKLTLNLRQGSQDVEYLDYRVSRVGSLEPLSKLTGLQSLSIEGATRAQRMSLQNPPASLVELKF